ncbi:hypothetical protein QM012_001946 [Aureobasidium pullulans]|uniref:Cep57 centrosome microtubule-binding domain-containing protein n=1 Tax=Aureobasidium pullulans TaxID=5580 RepID=A0ABR0TCY8_AURPU
MALATSAGSKTAVYHCAINASSDPTPLKPPSQKTQYITQVPESPSISQRARPIAASQSHSDDFVQDSLDHHPPAPARQPSTFLVFLKQSGPTEDSQPANASCEQSPIASHPQSQGLVIVQSPLKESPSKQLSSQNQIIEEDSVQIPPPAHLLSQKNTTGIPVKPQSWIPFQRQANTEERSQAHTPSRTEPDDDDDDEETQDCIVVRSRPASPPAARFGTRKTTKSPAGLSSVSRSSENIYDTTPLSRTGLSHPNVSATTGFTTPSMPPKVSTTKGTTSTSQSRKAASTASKKSSKAAPPLSNIINEGETSSAALLRNRKAGGVIQANTTRQGSEAVPKTVPGTKTSQKSAAHPVQAPASRTAMKSAQQGQSRPPAASTNEPSREAELPESRGEFDFSPDPVTTKRAAVPWRPEEGKVKPAKIPKSTAASLSLGKKSSKSQPKKKATKASESEEDNDDAEYSAPRTYKSKTYITTRASTRAQTQSVTQNDELNVSTRNTVASKTTRKQLPMSLKAASSRREEEIEDFENSITHINSGGAASPQPATESPPAKPLAMKQAKTRRMTEKEAQLMHDATSSPNHTTTPAATKPQTSTIKKAKVSQAKYSPAYQPTPEPGTTQRDPVYVEDDDSNEDEKDGTDEDLDASHEAHDKVTTEMMSQEPLEKQKTPDTKGQAQSRFGSTHKLPSQQSSDQMSNVQADLDAMAKERALRKPNIVGFDVDGPRNQGSRQEKKSCSSAKHNPPFEEGLSSDVDQESTQQPLVAYVETPGPDTRTQEAFDLDTTNNPAHVGTDNSLLATTPGEVAPSKSNPAGDQPQKTLASTGISSTKETELAGFEPLAGSAIIDHKRSKAQMTEAESMSNGHPNETQKSFGLQIRSASLSEDLAQELLKDFEDFDEKLYGTTDKAASLVPLAKEGSLRSKRPANQAAADSIHSVLNKHAQAASNHGDPRVRLRISQPQHTDGPLRTSGVEASMPTARPSQARVRSQLHQTTLSATDRKRPSVEVAEGGTKRLKIESHGHRTQVIQPATSKDSGLRKLSQVDDNGSPMPYGGKIAQEEAIVPRTRQKSITTASTPPRLVMHQSVEESFAQPMALARKEMGNSALHVSQPVTHAGFDEDIQATAEYQQTFGLHRKVPKHIFPAPCGSPPRTASAAQKLIGFIEALRSEVARRRDASEAKDNDGKEIIEREASMKEEDPDKTLVNEVSDDEDDSGDDNSGSRDSSDTDGEDVAKGALSMWRDALESHQGDVYDQLVRIAHRLTNHLKDHETAIGDISSDYSQDGMKLIQRLIKDNEAKLEQYRLKQSEMQGALVMRCDQVCGSLSKDMKDIRASGERFVKTLRRQVDAVGKLDHIMQAYQA